MVTDEERFNLTYYTCNDFYNKNPNSVVDKDKESTCKLSGIFYQWRRIEMNPIPFYFTEC